MIADEMSIVQMPISFHMHEIDSLSIEFIFYCMPKKNATEFNIQLLHGIEGVGEIVYSLHGSFKTKEIKIDGNNVC
jgi:hypothetical protein